MRFLADAGVSPKTVEFLRQLGEEVAHVRELGLERSLDSEIVERARADGSVVVTFDLDFGDVLALGVLDKPSVIIFRLADERADSHKLAHPSSSSRKTRGNADVEMTIALK
jgi:predicted nuclease of predicted toxin-antitoxin system